MTSRITIRADADSISKWKQARLHSQRSNGDLLKRLLTRTPTEYLRLDPAQHRELLTQLRAAGNLLNQAVRALNSGDSYPVLLSAALQAVEQASEEVTKCLR